MAIGFNLVKGRKHTWTILLLLVMSLSASGQQHYFTHYQADNGLLHNTVNSIIQDRAGFIWVGTKGGLNRFDGYNFKDYFLNRSKSGADNVVSLCEDKRGILWVGTQSGIYRFNPGKETAEELPSTPSIRINQIKTDRDNNVWFIAGTRLFKYDQQKSRAQDFNQRISALEVDDNGYLWTGNQVGRVKKINIRTGRINDVVLPEDRPFKHARITRIACTPEYALIGTIRGLLRYNRRTGDVVPLLSKDEEGAEIYVRDIQITAEGRTYYIATESGIFTYDSANQEIRNLKKKTGDAYSLNDNAVYTICADNRKGIWAGTFFGGINYYSKENSSFEKYYPRNAGNSISGNAVREICGDEHHNIWIGTEDAGITRFDVQNGSFRHLASGNHQTGFSYPNVHGLLVDSNMLYAGLFTHGLEVMDLSTGKITDRHPVIRPVNGEASSDFVMSIFKTSDERILVGTVGAGLYEYVPGLKQLTQIKKIPGVAFVNAIEEDHAGTIWTGSLSSGTFYFNPETGKSGNISFNTLDDEVRKFHPVQGIYEDSRHTLWFATEGGGLVKLDSSRTSFRRFTTGDGLPTNYIYRILEDDSNNLWISSLKGLICFNLDTEQFQIYTKSNGLITDQFNYNSAYRAPDGKMYFGTVKGMIAFYPDRLIKNSAPPPLYITGLQIGQNNIMPDDSSSVLSKSILLTDSISLDHNQTRFEIEFAALDFSSPHAIRYRYRMEGLDDKWTYLATNRKAYFTGLQPGTYRFTVQAVSNVGYWKTEPKELVITVLPPRWKSWPAYVCYAVILLSVIALTVYFYHRSVKKKNLRRLQLFEMEKEKEIYQAKIEFFTNIAHEIQTPLTLIKGPVEWALDKADDAATVKRSLKLVKKNTNRLVTLTSQLLDFRKAETDQFGLNFVIANIHDLLADLIIGFTPEIEKRNIRLHTEFPERELKAPIDEEAFNKIVSNLISNAVKYADQQIAVKLFVPGVSPGVFKITVANDGEPIPPVYRERIFEPFFRIQDRRERRGTGIGLSLARSLAGLHNGRLDIIDSKEQLNIFELTLPLHQEKAFKLRHKPKPVPK